MFRYNIAAKLSAALASIAFTALLLTTAIAPAIPAVGGGTIA